MAEETPPGVAEKALPGMTGRTSSSDAVGRTSSDAAEASEAADATAVADARLPRRGPDPWGPRSSRGAALRDGLRAYGLIVAMWVRSTMAYRASFVMTAFGNFAGSALDFVAILLMFSHVDTLGGYSLPEVAFLYGTSNTAFGLTDLALGSMHRLGGRVRDGTLDTLLLRPVPVLAQVAADRFALRRLGRITQGLLVLGYAVASVDVDWTVLRVLMVPMMVLSGAAIFAAVFVVGAAFQFWAQDASEVQNSFTYGGTTLLQYPPTVFAQDLLRGVTFLVPLAFVNWLPALYVLGREYPLDLPVAVAFLPPVVAAGCCGLAGLAWRTGLRAYRSTGS
nr:ABC transporter permease [Streptomyces sp. NRRL F-5135]